MKKIIVNADDFGINQTVTAEIERQILDGRVSSTTVMANGTCLDDVKRFAAEHSEVSYGVHLCLSEFDSLTKSDGLKKAGITEDDGTFIHKAIFHVKNMLSTEVMLAIRDELNAQIDVISALGFPISHADSHHHVHTIYPLKELFADVLHTRGIKRIRRGVDFRTMRMRLHWRLWMQRNQLNKYYSSEFITPTDFCSYLDFLLGGMNVQDNEIIELMCHPGHPGTKFQEEIKRMEQTTLPDDIKLISYNEL